MNTDPANKNMQETKNTLVSQAITPRSLIERKVGLTHDIGVVLVLALEAGNLANTSSLWCRSSRLAATLGATFASPLRATVTGPRPDFVEPQPLGDDKYVLRVLGRGI